MNRRSFLRNTTLGAAVSSGGDTIGGDTTGK